MYGYIYKTTNTINGKIYIGQHKAESFSLYYKGSGKIIQEAFNKYGKSNFTVELIKICLNKEELDYYEKYYIQKFNSQDLNIGYNISYGGNDGNQDLKWCNNGVEEIQFKELLPDGYVLGRLPMSIEQRIALKKPKSEKQKKIQSEIMLGRIKITNGLCDKCVPSSELPEYLAQGYWRGRTIGVRHGFKHSEETKLKMKENHNSTSSKPEVREKIRASVKKTTSNPEWKKQHSDKLKAIKRSLPKKHWFNNGIIEVLTPQCPENFTQGRLTQKKDTE